MTKDLEKKRATAKAEILKLIEANNMLMALTKAVKAGELTPEEVNAKLDELDQKLADVRGKQ